MYRLSKFSSQGNTYMIYVTHFKLLNSLSFSNIGIPLKVLHFQAANSSHFEDEQKTILQHLSYAKSFASIDSRYHWKHVKFFLLDSIKPKLLDDAFIRNLGRIITGNFKPL